MRITTPVSVLFWLLCGCTSDPVSGPVELIKVDTVANPCGEWQLNIRAHGSAGALVLEIDGRRQREWAVDGTMDLQVTGQAGPDQSLEMALIGPDLRHSIQVQMPQLIAELQGVPLAVSMAGDEIPFILKLVSPCTLRVALSWEILLDGEAFAQGRFIAGATETRLTLPPLVAGTHQIEATATWNDVSVSRWSQELEVSAQPGP